MIKNITMVGRKNERKITRNWANIDLKMSRCWLMFRLETGNICFFKVRKMSSDRRKTTEKPSMVPKETNTREYKMYGFRTRSYKSRLE